jgi:hypothetical protein
MFSCAFIILVLSALFLSLAVASLRGDRVEDVFKDEQMYVLTQ